MHASFESLIHRLVAPDAPLSGIDAAAGFNPKASGDVDVAASLNAAFLIRLCGPAHPAYEAAGAYLADRAGSERWSAVSGFLQKLIGGIDQDVEAASADAGFAGALAAAADPGGVWDGASQRRVWAALFPEGAWALDDPDARVAALRAARTVRIESPNPAPLSDPCAQLLVTSNILLTVPADPDAMRAAGYSDGLCRRVADASAGEQTHWFDHPIPLDVRPEANEVIYGLRGLNEAVAFEKRRGNAAPDQRLACVLSVTVTHPALRGLARDYLQESLSTAPAAEHLDVFVFSESAVDRLIDGVLAPAAGRWVQGSDLDALRRVFGVDGAYGRHYSFLKAMAALWQVVRDPAVRATFKIDLDQVFPQAELVAQGGGSAFDHFRSPLWGARGVDADGEPVELGMLAGALVNESDIAGGLFTPDVKRPGAIPAGEATVFYRRLPMALSTEAEMMTRYDGGHGVDGSTRALHRVHVTGGTNGILIDALRRHRPFAPSFVGRAEDQSYLMSVLLAGPPHLRYAHAAGLIMRHDKKAFAGEAIEAAKVGRVVGDLVRTVLFSGYARALPWGADRVKRLLDPFTGCYVSEIPRAIAGLRMALHAAAGFASADANRRHESMALLEMAADRLGELLDGFADGANPVKGWIASERAGWDAFYDILDALERAIGQGDPDAAALQREAASIIAECHVEPGGSRGV